MTQRRTTSFKITLAPAARLALTVAFASVTASAQTGEAPLTKLEQQGKRIYRNGIEALEIRARQSALELSYPGTDYACVKCHGVEGTGKLEAGIRVASIAPATLRANSNGNLKRKPYDDDTLAHAIRSGLDSESRPLNSLMPRYEIGAGDLAALLAYLKRLGNEPVPGVNEYSIQIGLLRPHAGEESLVARHLQTFLDNVFGEVNARGGINGRRLQTRAVEIDSSQDSSALHLGDDDEDEQTPFCVLANAGAAVEQFLARSTAARLIPVILPHALAPRADQGANNLVFFVQTSAYDQARVLADFARAHGLLNNGAALLYLGDSAALAAAAGFRDQIRGPPTDFVVDADASKLSAYTASDKLKLARTIVYFGPLKHLLPLLPDNSLENEKTLLLSGELSKGDLGQLPDGAFSHVYLASAAAAMRPNVGAWREHVRIVEKSGLPKTIAADVLRSAHVGAQLLIDALKRAGRNLTREKLSQVLAETRDFQTGLAPPISFGERRRTGSMGATVFELSLGNKTLREVAPYREPSARR